MLKRVLAIAVGVLACAPGAFAQDFRGSVQGRVTDPSGGVLIGADVTIENVATGVANKVKTNDTGMYQALYLVPGVYRITVESPGLRKAVRDRIELRVEDRLRVDVSLETTAATDEIQVIAEQPVLETSTATSGQVVDSKTIEEMPLADGTAYFLARLAPGVEFTADPKFTRPMDNVNLAGVSASGLQRSTAAGENNAVSSTEFSLDGAPNMVSQNRLGLSPPSSAVQEFKVSTALFDAQYGQGGGGSVSLALKSGTNDFKGEISYFNRDESRSGNTFWANKLEQPKEARDYHRATFTLHGPIRKNKTFFMISSEYLYDTAPEPLVTTVPTERMRRGDFGETSVIMYDPATSRRVPVGTGASTVVQRDRFPNNQIPESRIHPVARRVMEFFPLPNLPREQWRSDLTGNYYTDRNRPYKYDLGLARVDHMVNDTNKVFVNVFRNWREEDRSNWSGTELSQLLTYRTNTGAIMGWTSTLSPQMVLDVRVNAHHFGDWGKAGTGLRTKDLGFNDRMVALAGDHENVPRFDFETFSDFGRNATDVPFFTAGLAPTLTRMSGNHTLKVGYEARVIRESRIDAGDRAGVFTFRNNVTGAGTTNPGSGRFRDFSSFLLGIPGGGDFDTNTDRHNQVWYHGAFVQDDWRATSKLTINAGLRWEMEGGMTERFNRNTRGFDWEVSNPVEAQAKARFQQDFAANPKAYESLPGQYVVRPETFEVKGGYLFADENNRTLWDAQKLNFLPRLGFTYQLTNNLVVRAGGGMYLLPYKLSGIDQRGFSRSTQIRINDPVNSLPRLPGDPDGGIYGNPLPDGRLEPQGAALGLLTNLGGSTGVVINVENRERQRRAAYQLGFQYKLPFNTLFEANYVGSRGYNLITGRELNAIPVSLLIQSRIRVENQELFFTNDVPNPFRGIEAFRGDDHFNDLIDRAKLVRKYPHFESVRRQEHNGSTTYDSVQLRIEKRFAKGFMLSATYTYSELMESLLYLNAGDELPTERVSSGERPHTYKIATVIELPFGKGRKWMANAPGWLDAIAGGWRFSANYLWQSGTPVCTGNPCTLGNYYYDPARSPHDLKSRYGKPEPGKRYGVDPGFPAWDTSGFYFTDIPEAQRLADNRYRIDSDNYKRTFPMTIDSLRVPSFHNLDIGLAKTFDLRRAKLQLRVEAINAENYAQLSGLNVDPTSASFGYFNSQNNLPRDIQVGARLSF